MNEYVMWIGMQTSDNNEKRDARLLSRSLLYMWYAGCRKAAYIMVLARLASLAEVCDFMACRLCQEGPLDGRDLETSEY